MRTHLDETRLWLLFFFISFGLGYPTLNRYDVRTAVPDAAIYAKLAIHGPHEVESPLRSGQLLRSGKSRAN